MGGGGSVKVSRSSRSRAVWHACGEKGRRRRRDVRWLAANELSFCDHSLSVVVSLGLFAADRPAAGSEAPAFAQHGKELVVVGA
jgi:hypothetical protein